MTHPPTNEHAPDHPAATAADLVFHMGKFAAAIPSDRKYARNHLWAQPTGAGIWRIGFTAYSVRLLQDVYFLSWSVDPGAAVTLQQEIGEIESSKAVSTLHTPAAGVLVGFNERLLEDPSAINVDGYDTGWLYELRCADDFLTPAAYLEVLEASWEKTQALLKGQVNQADD